MTDRPSLVRFSATLLPAVPMAAGGRLRTYRLLAIGPALLERSSATTGPWHVRVTTDGSFLPRAPRSPAGFERRITALRSGGGVARLGAAILEPRDLSCVAAELRPTLRGHGRASLRHEFYGWALMYQLPDSRGIGLVDPHDEFTDLPAFFESPLELADRQEYLARRCVATRAIALVTQPEDFDAGEQAVPWNRYCPAARWRRAHRLTAFDR
ncbi:MAG: hypothetical protein K8S94_13145 [Planctomycetia bacterium]|nr:hypothetical protein [Planctomycetia bacterium]